MTYEKVFQFRVPLQSEMGRERSLAFDVTSSWAAWAEEGRGLVWRLVWSGSLSRSHAWLNTRPMRSFVVVFLERGLDRGMQIPKTIIFVSPTKRVLLLR